MSQKIIRACALWGLAQIGCTSTADPVGTPDATTAPDATSTLDVTNTAGEAVWTSASVGFSLRVSGGLPSPPLGGTCDGNNHTYTYDHASGSLRHVGCEVRSLVNRAVVLDAAGRAALAAELAALRTTTTLGCGADYHDLVLTVSNGASAGRTYNSTYFAGCPGSPLPAPFIAGDALDRLDAVLRYTIETCAAGDAGPRCTAVDAGAPDGG